MQNLRPLLVIVSMAAACAAGARADDQHSQAPTGSAAAAERLIPVATENGIHPMRDEEYRAYVGRMGHLPNMPQSFVFGRTIARPKTDKKGHIHLTNPQGAAERQPASRPIPVQRAADGEKSGVRHQGGETPA